MQRRLVTALLAVVVVALLAFTVPVGLGLAALLRDNLRDVVLREARTIAFLLADPGSESALTAFRGEFEAQSGGRVELLDEQRRPALSRPVANPRGPDVTAAFAGAETVQWADAEEAGGAAALVVTVPARPAGAADVVGMVRVTYPTAELERQIRDIWVFRAVAGVAAVALAAVLAVLVARSLSRPLRELERAAIRFGRGELDVRAPEIGPPETRRVACAINEGAQRLERLIRTQQEFLAHASHQLRSPLTALRLSLDNVADQIEDPAARKSVDPVIAEVVRLSRLVNSMLVLARAQADGAVRHPVDVGELVGTRSAAWRAAATDRAVRLDRATSGPPMWAWLGAGHLEQILDNLIANALYAAPAGSTVTVGVDAPDPRRVRVRVIDHGPGMTGEQRDRAFDRFGSGKAGGTGLGLAIVRQLVEYFGDFLELQPSGTLVEPHVRTFGSDAAVLSGLYEFAVVSDGEPATVSARMTYVFERSGDDWLISEHHSSKLP